MLETPDAVLSQSLSLRYPASAVHIGAALGNRRCYAQFDPEGNLENLWGVDDEYWCGTVRVEVFQDGVRLPASEVEFHQAYTRSSLELPGVRASKTVFLPLAPPLCSVIWELEVSNTT